MSPGGSVFSLSFWGGCIMNGARIVDVSIELQYALCGGSRGIKHEAREEVHHFYHMLTYKSLQ